MTRRRGLLGRIRSSAPVNLLIMKNFVTWSLVHVLLSSLSRSSQAFHRSPPRSLRTASSPSWPRGRLRPAGSSRLKGEGEGFGLQAGHDRIGDTRGCDDDGGGSRNRNEGREPVLSITTFNVLAPIFKRVGAGRESEFRDSYLERHSAILEHLKAVGSDVICLQELWLAEQEMVDMYQRSLEGYRMYALPRSEARGDGVACFVKEGIEVLDRQDLRLKGMGGRVALILRLSIGRGDETSSRREVVVANTHLLFPHARTFSILRIREVKKLLAFVECYTQANDLAHLPVVLCGDFNGKSSGRVYQHLTEKGFRCSYEDVLAPDADRSRWITHVNHLGEQLGVDYVWYRNPDPLLGPMEPAWESIVYQSTKQQLLGTSPLVDLNTNPLSQLAGNDNGDFLALEADEEAAAEAVVAVETPAELSLPQGCGVSTSVEAAGGGGRKRGDVEKDRLSAACQLLGLSEGFDLSDEELKLLLDSSVDDFDFLVPTILDGSSTGLEGAGGASGAGGGSTTSSRGDDWRARPGGCTLEAESSRIWPRSLEQGLWPKDYVMSDHGSLTAYFRVAPVTAGMAHKLVGVTAGPVASVEGGQVETRGDEVGSKGWDGFDDGHYGLR